jgi:tetratricopeptide (TPR) repeat protein
MVTVSVFIVLLVNTAVLPPGVANAQPATGRQAPGFSLADVDGRQHDLSSMKDASLVILYFFDAESRPSQEGLVTLDQLVRRHPEAQLAMWGITQSPEEKVAQFMQQTHPQVPILIDNADVSAKYDAGTILPTVCVLGPELKVMNFFQGGGRGTEVMLLGLAEKELQRREYAIANDIGSLVESQNPGNMEALAVKGHSYLKQGRLADAEKTFTKIAVAGGKDKNLGREGLAEVAMVKGDTQKALALADEIQTSQPDRVAPHLVKSQVLMQQGRKKAAEQELKIAVAKTSARPTQKAQALNQLGRLRASVADYKSARNHFENAVKIDPYYVEAMSNKGLTYEKEAKWDQALGSYKQVTDVNSRDMFAAALAKRAQERLDYQNNAEKKERIDRLVKDLAERYRKQQEAGKAEEDQWTSRPLILSFVDFREKGAWTERDGLSIALTTQIAELLNASNRARVVERIVIDRLLEELNIGSSELADPRTALRLGRVLAAKIIGTGSLFYRPTGDFLSLRLIDTETTEISKVINYQFQPGIPLSDSLERDANRLNREILGTIITKYPLQGFVVKVDGDSVMLNLGSKQGVVSGARFVVLEDQEPIEYKGKRLQQSPKPIAAIEVSQVERDLSYARIVSKQRAIRPDDKVREQKFDSN